MFFFTIILIIGILTTFTDLKSKKIYNLHLIIGALLGLIAVAYSSQFKHENILFHITNGSVASLIGFLLYRSDLWRGGDAKLFSFYAFVMPIPTYNHIILPCIVSLFSCSFIAGAIILSPAFIKDIIINHKTILSDLLSPLNGQAIFDGVMRTVFFSWVCLPLFDLAGITNPIVILTSMFLFFSWRYGNKRKIDKHHIINFFKNGLPAVFILLILGFLTHLWASPKSLSFSALTKFILMVALSSSLSICIQTSFNHFKNYHERVPFAPLLFIGCILSYTPFLTTLIPLLTQWRTLFIR